MDQDGYIAPEFDKEAFHCPHCNVFAHQLWDQPYYKRNGWIEIPSFRISRCQHCRNYSYWIQENLIYPAKITAPLAHKDMPDGVSEYYNEARAVSAHSSRAAAALLRIAAKKLSEELGEDESNLYRAIGNLRKKGLPETVIQSLDAVGIVGNEGGAHEGQIDLTGEDNKDLVNGLFRLVNFIVEKTITDPAEVEDIFSSLPKNQRQAAERRDNQQ